MEYQKIRFKQDSEGFMKVASYTDTGVYYKRITDYEKAWKDFIAQHGPYEYHLSTTFNGDFKEDVGKSHLDYFIHLINQHVYNQHYKQKDRHIKGFAFMERQALGPIHFHMLINADAKLNEKCSFSDLVMSLLPKVRKTHLSDPKYSSQRTMTSKGVKIIPVRDEKIISYLIKTMEGWDSSFIGFLGKDGAEWVDKENRYYP